MDSYVILLAFYPIVLELMYSLLRIKYDISVNSDQLSIDFHPRLTLGLFGANKQYHSINDVRDTRGSIIFFY